MVAEHFSPSRYVFSLKQWAGNLDASFLSFFHISTQTDPLRKTSNNMYGDIAIDRSPINRMRFFATRLFTTLPIFAACWG